MNKFYLIFLISSLSFGQPNPEKKTDTSKRKDITLKPIIADTINIKNTNTFTLWVWDDDASYIIFESWLRGKNPYKRT